MQIAVWYLIIYEAIRSVKIDFQNWYFDVMYSRHIVQIKILANNLNGKNKQTNHSWWADTKSVLKFRHPVGIPFIKLWGSPKQIFESSYCVFFSSQVIVFYFMLYVCLSTYLLKSFLLSI